MIRADEIVIQIEMMDVNKMVVCCNPVSEGYLYAFQLFCNDKMVDRILYSEQSEALFWLSQTGKYSVRVCVKEGEKSVAKFSEIVEFQNQSIHLVVEEKKVGIIDKVKFITNEIINNFPKLYRIARYDYKLLNKDAYLGGVWNILTPLIQIAVYWLVFGLGIRNGSEINGHPFLLWMLCGLVPWFFISESINKGASSIYNKARIITKMKYPISTVPIGTIVTAWMEHMMVLLILFITLFTKGYYPTRHFLNLIYYIFYSFFFLSSLALITSVLTMLARDFQKLLTSIIRLLFYLTPILWSMENMPEIYQKILEFNPVLYVVNGFRESLLYQINFWEHPDKILLFWTANVILFVIGCGLQYKYRKKFNDLL